MKQSSSSSSSAYLQANYGMNDYEMEVAAILLELPQLILSGNRLPLSWPSWGTKRRRSAEENASLRRVRFPSPLPSLPEFEKPASKIEASSPATPLSFSPSESDEKPKRLKRKVSLKTKEELLQIKNECTRTNKLLRKEIEESRNYLMHLEAQNLSLEARKQELILGIKNGKPRVLKASRRLEQQIVVKPATNAEDHHHRHHHHNINVQMVIDQRTLMMDKNASCGQAVSLYRSSSGMGMSVGPSGIPDLNVSPPPAQGESQSQLQCGIWMDYDSINGNLTKAMAAQARHRRMLICRDKNFNGNIKLRISNK